MLGGKTAHPEYVLLDRPGLVPPGSSRLFVHRMTGEVHREVPEEDCSRGGILGDAPGTGKTVVVLADAARNIGFSPEAARFDLQSYCAQAWSRLEQWDFNLLMIKIAKNVATMVNQRCGEGAADLFFDPVDPDFTLCGVRYGDVVSEAASTCIQNLGSPAGKPASFGDVRAGYTALFSNALRYHDCISHNLKQAEIDQRNLLQNVKRIADLMLAPEARLGALFDRVERNLAAGVKGFAAAEAASKRIASDVSLVVVPAHLIDQWYNEATTKLFDRGTYTGLAPKHLLGTTTAGGENITPRIWGVDGELISAGTVISRGVYKDDGGALPSSAELSKYWLVIIGETRLKQEAGGLDSSGSHASSSSSLLGIRFGRMYVDEGSMLGATSMSNTKGLLERIDAASKWVVSGTPTKEAPGKPPLRNLRELLQFIGEPPFGVPGTTSTRKWNDFVATPFVDRGEDAAAEVLRTVLSRAMVCNPRLVVAPEVTTTLIDLSENERHTYNSVLSFIKASDTLTGICSSAADAKRGTPDADIDAGWRDSFRNKDNWIIRGRRLSKKAIAANRAGQDGDIVEARSQGGHDTGLRPAFMKLFKTQDNAVTKVADDGAAEMLQLLKHDQCCSAFKPDTDAKGIDINLPCDCRLSEPGGLPEAVEQARSRIVQIAQQWIHRMKVGGADHGCRCAACDIDITGLLILPGCGHLVCPTCLHSRSTHCPVAGCTSDTLVPVALAWIQPGLEIEMRTVPGLIVSEDPDEEWWNNTNNPWKHSKAAYIIQKLEIFEREKRDHGKPYKVIIYSESREALYSVGDKLTRRYLLLHDKGAADAVVADKTVIKLESKKKRLTKEERILNQPAKGWSMVADYSYPGQTAHAVSMREMEKLRYFDPNSDCNVMLLGPQYNEGLDLPNTTHIFILGAVTEDTKMRQLLARAARLGRDEHVPVKVEELISAGTVEVAAIQTRKRECESGVRLTEHARAVDMLDQLSFVRRPGSSAAAAAAAQLSRINDSVVGGPLPTHDRYERASADDEASAAVITCFETADAARNRSNKRKLPVEPPDDACGADAVGVTPSDEFRQPFNFMTASSDGGVPRNAVARTQSMAATMDSGATHSDSVDMEF